MTSLAYGPCPITSLIPLKKDMGSVLTRTDSTSEEGEERIQKKKKKKKDICTHSFFCLCLVFVPMLTLRLILNQ